MTTQPVTPTPKPTNPDTLALLVRIAEATERQIVLLDELRAEINNLAAIAPANASSSQPAQVEGYITFTAETILLDYANGKPVYKAKGGQYQKFGVRIWPETLPDLGIDPTKLIAGSNPIQPLLVRAVLGDSGQPRKIIGKV